MKTCHGMTALVVCVCVCVKKCIPCLRKKTNMHARDLVSLLLLIGNCMSNRLHVYCVLVEGCSINLLKKKKSLMSPQAYFEFTPYDMYSGKKVVFCAT